MPSLPYNRNTTRPGYLTTTNVTKKRDIADYESQPMSPKVQGTAWTGPMNSLSDWTPLHSPAQPLETVMHAEILMVPMFKDLFSCTCWVQLNSIWDISLHWQQCHLFLLHQHILEPTYA